MEAKLDAILLAVAPDDGERAIGLIDSSYGGRNTDTEHERLLAEQIRRHQRS